MLLEQFNYFSIWKQPAEVSLGQPEAKKHKAPILEQFSKKESNACQSSSSTQLYKIQEFSPALAFICSL